MIDQEDIIGFYEKEFYFLSNFASFQVEWKGRLWQTSEHAYQASKFFEVDDAIVDEIFKTTSAYDAKKVSKNHIEKVRPHFGSLKISIMEDICRHKLQQHLYIQEKLLETRDKEIIENSLHDAFWGWGENKDGRNELGKIWMRLREELVLE